MPRSVCIWRLEIYRGALERERRILDWRRATKVRHITAYWLNKHIENRTISCLFFLHWCLS